MNKVVSAIAPVGCGDKPSMNELTEPVFVSMILGVSTKRLREE